MATLRGSRIFLSNREYQIFSKMVEHPMEKLQDNEIKYYQKQIPLGLK